MHIPDQPEDPMDLRQPSAPRKRVFISYKRNAVPDDALANDIYAALSEEHDIFIDQKSMSVGTNWAKRIDDELRRSDFLIPLLSEAAVQSEMVVAEIEKARHLSQEQGGPPQVLPVRVAYEAPFSYPLSAYLNHINWAAWSGPGDTERVIKELLAAIATGSMTEPATQAPQLDHAGHVAIPTPVAQLEVPGGTMSPESQFYVRRRVDDAGEAAVQYDGFTLVIKGPRQVGKSSLLLRLCTIAAARNHSVVLIDFERFSKPILQNSDRFFRQFCSTVALKTRTPVARLDDYWSLDVDNIFRTSEFFEDVILSKAQSPITLAMDEVDSVFLSSFRSDFFGMLRSWHNSRASNKLWKNLNLALVTSTEPYRFIEDLTQSPFNVADTIEPDDFTYDQVAYLASLHDVITTVAGPLLSLLNGHPYLTRKALFLLKTKRYSLAELLRDAATERGPFADHLRYHLFRLNENPELIEPLLQVLGANTCDNEHALFRLEGAGLVRKSGLHKATLRCQLYSTFFEEHLREVADVQRSR